MFILCKQKALLSVRLNLAVDYSTPMLPSRYLAVTRDAVCNLATQRPGAWFVSFLLDIPRAYQFCESKFEGLPPGFVYGWNFQRSSDTAAMFGPPPAPKITRQRADPKKQFCFRIGSTSLRAVSVLQIVRFRWAQNNPNPKSSIFLG